MYLPKLFSEMRVKGKGLEKLESRRDIDVVKTSKLDVEIMSKLDDI